MVMIRQESISVRHLHGKLVSIMCCCLRNRSVSELLQILNSEQSSVQTNSNLWLMYEYWFYETCSIVVRYPLQIFISLAHLTVNLNSFFHLRDCFHGSMLSGGMYSSSSERLDDHLESVWSNITFRIHSSSNAFLYFVHFSKILHSRHCRLNQWREELIWKENMELKNTAKYERTESLNRS
jgi:hypothetical protein